VPASYKSSGVIRLVTDYAEPPMMYAKDSTPPGLVFDVTDEIAKRLGLKIQTVVIAASSTWPTALAASRVDMLPTFNDTTEREATYDFVDWAYNSSIFIVPYGNPKKINTWADTCGLKVGIISGTTSQAEAQAESNRCVADGKAALKILTYSGIPAENLALQSGQADMYIGSGNSAPYAAAHAGDGKQLTAVQTSVSYKVPEGLGLRKADAGLADAVAAALTAMQADGTYAKLFAKYDLTYAALPTITRNTPGEAIPTLAPEFGS
jgi:polar amino acid transport system substrate-binding protein